MSDFRIKTCVLGTVSTNCYIVSRDGKAVIIDPADDFSYLQVSCEELGARPCAVLLTHGHFDHILAAKSLRDEFQIPVYCGAQEKALLEDPSLNLSKNFGLSYEITPDHLCSDDEEIQLLDRTWKVITTPGHTAGSVSYLVKEEEVLFSGDTLFEGTFGRTDLPTSSTAAIVDSITKKLFALPDDTMVYPGHGNPTTIGREKQDNPVTNYVRR